MNRYLRLAHELTKYSLAKQQRMAAVVVKGGSVLSTGVNYRFHHAEARAIRPHKDFTGATIYVARHNQRCSRPCNDCQRKIIRAGIKRAVYISQAGTVVTERFGP
jgi:deoxycytidylate deaminase